MKVAVLQQYLRGLAAPLQAAGATPKVTGDLEQTAQALEPFKDQDFGQVAAFLAQADELQRTGVLPMLKAKSRSGAGKNLNEAQIGHVAEQLRRLAERAAAAGESAEALAPDVDRLGLENLSKAEAVAVARVVGARTTTRMGQPEVVQQLRRVVLGGSAAPEAAATEAEPQSRVQDLAQQVRQLEEQAAGADASHEGLRSQLDHLRLDALSHAELLGVAQELGLGVDPESPAEDVVRRIRRSVLDRKQAPEAAPAPAAV